MKELTEEQKAIIEKVRQPGGDLGMMMSIKQILNRKEKLVTF